MRMPGVSQSHFAETPRAEIPRSVFNRSFSHKTTFDGGLLIPVFVDEALPGDTFRVKMSAFARLATPLKPIMDNLYLDSFFFAVPYRLIWENWEKFNGAQTNPGDTTDYLVPTVTIGVPGWEPGSLGNYMGLRSGVGSMTTSSLPMRAYNLIWNEWFRDQNLQNSVAVPVDDGPDDYADFVVLRRGKRHDYFTSCLPWPQKGDSVSLSLFGTAPVTGLGNVSTGLYDPAGPPSNVNETGQTGFPTTYSRAYKLGDPEVVYMKMLGSDGLTAAPDVWADLSGVTSGTINQLRQAFQVQKLLERDARGGTRYTEIVRAHFGVTSPDARLQRPEYLGGGRSPVSVSPIAQTSSTDATTPQGNLAAMGTAAFSGHGFAKSFTEHCILIGLICATADLTYQQGVERMWHRRTRYDFYWPALANIGEQAVLSKEIFMEGAAADEDVFGYQERYAEYRYKPSLVTGLFNSTATGNIDIWHLAQEFASRPTLGATFIQEDPPIDRVIAVPSEPHFLLDTYFDMRCARPMPVYGVPGLVDHF